MESKLKKIREAIHDDFKVYDSDSWSQFHLKERDKASCKSVVLKRQTGIKTVVIELDKKGIEIHPLLAPKTGLKKKNDYLIFALKNRQLYTLLIELKSNNPDDWIKQCKAGRVISEYIIKMVNNWAKDIVIEENNFNFRYILFHTNENNSFKNKRKKNTRNTSFAYSQHPTENYYSAKLMCNKEYNLGMFCK